MNEQDKFKRSLDFVLKWEGGWSNHPNDPGGATMRGVIQSVYDAYRYSHGMNKQSVKNITDEELQEIYLNNYWKPARCNELPWPECAAKFDTAVNCGVSRANRWGEDRNAHELLVERARHYLSLVFAKPKQFRVFLKGWLNRLADLTGLVAGG